MLFYIIIASILNILLVIIGTKFLLSLTILGFIFIIYLFPLILNSALSASAVLKKKKNHFIAWFFQQFLYLLILL
ncbi:hypothetical protein ACVRV9_01880 [Streptococcus vestibularis]|uniref:hypothetical protein n=1 Tax=Streptococcus vestibularis TaxID=1343 RepID=UPI000F6ED4DC|nr:hypothetical protein [Streptococcus vestibularis]VED89662.1 Uncharacterised protein [Streptococcus vestibularis]